jgi:hypothetical protein
MSKKEKAYCTNMEKTDKGPFLDVPSAFSSVVSWLYLEIRGHLKKISHELISFF